MPPSERQHLEVFCPAEREVYGSLSGPSGERMTADRINRGYEPANGHARPEFVDHEITICPRCGNPMILVEPGTGPDSKPEETVTLAPSLLRFP